MPWTPVSKCAISHPLTYGRLCPNQNFLDACITKLSYPWGSAARTSRKRQLRYQCRLIQVRSLKYKH